MVCTLSHTRCIAGHTIAWTLYLVSQHPQAEAALAAELDAAGLLVTAARPAPRALTFDDLGALPYLAAVIKARALPARPPFVPGPTNCATGMQ